MAIGAGLRSIHSNMGSVALQGCWFLVGPHVKPSKFDCELPENKLINFHFATKTAKLATFLSVRSTQNGTIIRNSAAWFVNTPMISPFWLVILISFKNMLVTSTMPFAWSNHILETMDQPWSKEVWKSNFRQYGEMKKQSAGRRVRREKIRRKKTQVREKIGKSRSTVFFRGFVAPEGWKIGSLKRRVRRHLGRWEMKSCTLLWREAHLEVKCVKNWGVRTTFGSWDVEKVHAVVARSTFRSQNVQNTPLSDHFWKLRCRKSARRCGAKHISKSKCTKHHMFAPLLEVQMSKKCTPLWREAHFKVKMLKAPGVRTTFGSSDVTSLHSTTLHYTTLHYTTPHYTTLHYTTLQLQLHNYTPLHSTTLNYTTLHFITLHYTPLHYTALPSTTLHYIPLHFTTLQLQLHNYSPLQYTPLH